MRPLPEQPAQVLLVDDDATLLRYGRMSLTAAGYGVDVEHSVNGALAALARRPYDLLITDLHFGRDSGMRILRELPPLQQHLPVVVLTGMPTLESAMEGVHHAVVAYAVKPVVDLPGLAARALHRGATRRLLHRSEEALRQCNEQLAGLAAEVARLRETLVGLNPRGQPAPNPLDTQVLSDRERDLVDLLCSEGLCNKELADRLALSENTVKNHLKAIFRKLGVRSRAELVLRYRGG